MDSKSLEILEFPQIREILAGFTSFSASRGLASSLEPLVDPEQITRLLKHSAEARGLLSLDPGFSIGNVTDIREMARLASLGKILEPENLMEIQQTLSSIYHLRRNLAGIADDFPRLWDIAGGLVDLKHIAREIAGCLGPAGEVLDTASANLAHIRQQLGELRRQLLERLEGIIRSPKGRKILQDNIITEREGRYVILVKMECRHEIKGIVHDISNTGETVFIEPSVAVGLGNAIRELAIEERREIERILGKLSSDVGVYYPEIDRSIGLVAELDLALAKARYARQVTAAEPDIAVFGKGKGGDEPASTLRLVEARHPLLPANAVPLSVEIGGDFRVLLITGPNTGGKTVALKTIGLLSLMAQAGIPIPASPESCLPVFDSIFADIGDEQSIEQTLSTFSWHVGNVVRIINRATGRSLVLLDELGTSTDPAEGSALARAILHRFLSQGITTVATTHYSDLKAFAHVTPGLENASLEFDPVTLSPTYRLVVGIPGGSNALATASRLGIPPEVITEARGMLAEGSQELETLLTSLMAEKQKLENISREMAGEKATLEQQNAELSREWQRFKAEERKIIQEVRDRVSSEAAELYKTIRQTAAELRKEQSRKTLEQARKAMASIQEQMGSETWQVSGGGKTAPGESEIDERINIGDTVWVREANLPATVLSISEPAQQVEVQAGRTRMRLGLDSVAKVARAPGQAPMEPAAAARPVSGRIAPREYDLRGKHADEVEWALDSYLNDAARANLNEVRIIHGIATGTVRRIVRELVAAHPLVKAFRPGEKGEGGDGVTVVTL